MSWFQLPLLLGLASTTSAASPYNEYILAPSSRTIYPAAIHRVNGSVTNAESLLSSSTTPGNATLRGNASVTFDYTKDIAGIISITTTAAPSDHVVLGVTFTESSLWINGAACDATADAGLDTPLWIPVAPAGVDQTSDASSSSSSTTYTVAPEFQRGGFRYLSLVSNSSTPVTVTSITLEFTAAPMQELQEYAGYFHSDDELLNQIWYAGAYTCQLCSIDPAYGDSLIWLGIINSSEVIELPQTILWYNNYTITNGTSALVDGAKRDRLVWPGDIVVAAPTIFVSTNDMASLRNGLESLLANQNSSGALPYAGSPFQEKEGLFSFTYHMHNLLDIDLYYHFTNDLAWLEGVWKKFTLGLAFSISHVDETGLMNVTTGSDWLRAGMGGHNIEANAIFYHTLTRGVALATVLNDTASVTSWSTIAADVKTAANHLLWDNSTLLFRDNETTTLHPQDGNAWAVYSNITLSATQASAITAKLHARWGPYGAPAPEVGSTPETVSPFIGYFELLAHYTTGNARTALDLMRLQWGDFMLDDPRMTNSTFIEGYGADGSLHYAPYTNDARVSHAHGWSTGPTSVLTLYTAGLRTTAAGGQEWLVAPRLGGLASVQTGYMAITGPFAIDVQAHVDTQVVSALSFLTPVGTIGVVSLPGVSGSLVNNVDGTAVTLVDGEAVDVPGGNWTLVAS